MVVSPAVTWLAQHIMAHYPAKGEFFRTLFPVERIATTKAAYSHLCQEGYAIRAAAGIGKRARPRHPVGLKTGARERLTPATIAPPAYAGLRGTS